MLESYLYQKLGHTRRLSIISLYYLYLLNACKTRCNYPYVYNIQYVCICISLYLRYCDLFLFFTVNYKIMDF